MNSEHSESSHEASETEDFLGEVDLNNIQPYMYEPEASTSSKSEDPDDDPENRLINTNW